MKEIFSQLDDIRVVGEATNTSEALEVIRETKPDVALVDIQIPGGGGIEVIKSGQVISSNTKFLVVSAYDDYAYIVAALEAGAKGYILKTADSNELINAIRSVSTGATVVDDEIAKRLRKRWQTEHKVAIDLTSREIDVLRCLAKGLSNKQVARELNLGIRTIEGYVSNILAKLNVQSRTEAAIWAVQNRVIEPMDPMASE
jgi:NarL family two-component system response regulator LiaR